MTRIIRAKDLPNWKRPSTSFIALLKPVGAGEKKWRHRNRRDAKLTNPVKEYTTPGYESCGKSWCCALWRLERDALKRRGEHIGNRLVFAYRDGFLEHVGYDSRYKIRMQWFGFMPDALKDGDRVIILL